MRDKRRGRSEDVKSVLDHEDLRQCPSGLFVRKERKNRADTQNVVISMGSWGGGASSYFSLLLPI